MLHGDKERELEIKAMLRRQLQKAGPMLLGHKVFLFGSRAMGDAGPRSDFDVGVFGGEPLPLRDYFAIEDMLDALPTLYKIDWVDFNRVSPEFREWAMKQIEFLYE
ncbi:DNA polymerase III subunit beta [Sulfuricella sp. T08]|uniref:nucleotidyltransferase domain-containing protein n=1 Tax=Sulfuricella sp. T08 TaxID=1632857 RepID=UPI000617A1D4|nr:nucleotidyltransferase domain-containing protein [Sulfuricella sp. T08]GAO34806.1 DNA polymerase III subunit beta [Sulfuricella sp. T08]